MAWGHCPESWWRRSTRERKTRRIEMRLVVSQRCTVQCCVELPDCEVWIRDDGVVEVSAGDDEPLGIQVAQSLIELLARGRRRGADRAGVPDGRRDHGSRRLCGDGSV